MERHVRRQANRLRQIERHEPRHPGGFQLQFVTYRRAFVAHRIGLQGACLRPAALPGATVKVIEHRAAPVTLGRWWCWTLEVHTKRNRSEEHTSELQSLMRISYAVFCLTKKQKKPKYTYTTF